MNYPTDHPFSPNYQGKVAALFATDKRSPKSKPGAKPSPRPPALKGSGKHAKPKEGGEA